MRIFSPQVFSQKHETVFELLLAWIISFVIFQTNKHAMSIPITIIASVFWIIFMVLRYPKYGFFSQKFFDSFFVFELFVLLITTHFLGPSVAVNNVLSQATTFCGIYFFYVYTRRFSQKRFQILVLGILTAFCLEGIKLTILCIQNPNIGRFIVAGAADEEISKSVGHPYGIAQAGCFIVIAVCRILTSSKFLVRNPIKFALIIIAGILALTVYEIQSTITTLLMLVGCMGAIFLSILEGKKGKKRRKIIIVELFCILTILILYLSKARIGMLLVEIFSESSSVFGKRVVEMGKALAFNEMSNDLQARAELMMQSVNVFLKHPLLGSIYTVGFVTGGHCAVLDLFADFGLLGGIPQLMIVVFYFRWMKKKMYSFDIFLWLPLLISACVNPLSMYQTYFASLFIAPALFFAFQKNV